jgi:hypothetical protein
VTYVRRHPGWDTYTGRWCKCGHREEDHSGWVRPGRTHECWSDIEVVEGMGTVCSCYGFSEAPKPRKAKP